MGTLKPCQFKILILHFLLTFFHGDAFESNGFSLKLIPWDSPKSPLYHPNLAQTQKLQMMAMSSKARAIFPNPTNETFYSKAIQLPMTSHGLSYSVDIKIGSRGTKVTLLVDTGSGFTWTQCTESTFNPKESKTYKEVPCQHTMCRQGINSRICRCIEEKCVCSVAYGNRANHYLVEGILSDDSFTLPIKKKTPLGNNMQTFKDIIFGCSHRPTSIPGISGVLGLNHLPVSLVGQLNHTVRWRYSYCLHERGGYVRFGNAIPRVGKHAKTTRLIKSPFHTFVNLRGISVDHKRLALSPALFSSKEGEILVDTGAQLTMLKGEAYHAVIRELAHYYDDNSRLTRLNTSGRGIPLELCYEKDEDLHTMTYASMTLHLDGADYEINNLYEFPVERVMCVGLLQGDMWVLGALQQRDKRFIFDLNANELKFDNENCWKDRG